LNASYAADGYGRVRGAATLSTTYAVREVSAINGVMGAKAERSLVFHVVGMPSDQNQRLHKTMHHIFGDGGRASMNEVRESRRHFFGAAIAYVMCVTTGCDNGIRL
jgi:TPP-dependent 2-oxoacid decarboxylase